MSSMNCIVCGRPLNNHENDCPRCKFHYLDYMGGDWEQAMEAQKPDAAYYRTNTFLPKFDLGVTRYRWMDDNGTIALASVERLSFGTAADLENNTVWLSQEFARLPDEKQLTVEVSVREEGAAERTLVFTLPALDQPELQLLGLEMNRDLKLTLKLKTASGKNEVASNAICLLAD